ncbi:Rho-type GTPase-activating protein 1 [Zancudomyces culisetae]|uniref:Rho-type GTPase-activating protein 1 n=1 Tax=Zancudomyces culisetae TaxID=1213189 RepID=A0A1R1PCN9_ZANCU|nr:Rho-type GTPase-activating protein 1 [Zancudomyces culisetae]|eukprot:OMH78713.1 Rho-type GTPase-activating protein 1 [Zancudomyces culisetae]
MADKDYAGVNLSSENPVQVAALMKKFCREIPDPLVPFRSRRLFLAILAIPEHLWLEAFQCAILLLPSPNRDMLNVLLTFLRWVSQFSYINETSGSKMDSKNLAVVITPNILYADVKEPTSVDNNANSLKYDLKDDTFSYSATAVINYIIDKTPEAWQLPRSLVMFLQTYMKQLLPTIRLNSDAAGSAGAPYSTTIEFDTKDLYKKCEAVGLLVVPSPSNLDYASNTSNISSNTSSNLDPDQLLSQIQLQSSSFTTSDLSTNPIFSGLESQSTSLTNPSITTNNTAYINNTTTTNTTSISNTSNSNININNIPNTTAINNTPPTIIDIDMITKKPCLL